MHQIARRRYSLGDMPVSWRNVWLKWDTLGNPV